MRNKLNIFVNIGYDEPILYNTIEKYINITGTKVRRRIIKDQFDLFGFNLFIYEKN